MDNDWVRVANTSSADVSSTCGDDGVDEAGDCREAIDEFVLCRLLPSGNRLVCTSRPEGVRRDLYAWRFVVVDLEPLTIDQLCDAIQMLDADEERVFDKLLEAQDVRHKQDALFLEAR